MAVREGLEDQNQWSDYRRLVTQTLKDLDQDIQKNEEKFDRRIEELRDRMDKRFNDLADKMNDAVLAISNQVTELKTRASMLGGIWGLLGGALVTLVVELIVHVVVK